MNNTNKDKVIIPPNHSGKWIELTNEAMKFALELANK
jgi:hypothetical protein